MNTYVNVNGILRALSIMFLVLAFAPGGRALDGGGTGKPPVVYSSPSLTQPGVGGGDILLIPQTQNNSQISGELGASFGYQDCTQGGQEDASGFCVGGLNTVQWYWSCNVTDNHCGVMFYRLVILSGGDVILYEDGQTGMGYVENLGLTDSLGRFLNIYHPAVGENQAVCWFLMLTTECGFVCSTYVNITNNEPPVLINDSLGSIMASHSFIDTLFLFDADSCDIPVIDSITLFPEFQGFWYSQLSPVYSQITVISDIADAVGEPKTYSFIVYMNDNYGDLNSTNIDTISFTVEPCPSLIVVMGPCDEKVKAGELLLSQIPTVIQPAECNYNPPEFMLISVSPNPVGSVSINYGQVTFNTDVLDADTGDTKYTINMGVTGGGDTTFYSFDILVFNPDPYSLMIEEVYDQLPEFPMNIDIISYGEPGSSDINEFQFEVEYNNDLLKLLAVEPGQGFNQYRWEFFEYDTAFSLGCDGTCNAGFIGMHGIADIENGDEHPNPGLLNDPYGFSLATMTFLVRCDTSGFDSAFYFDINPVKWSWSDCSDNMIIASSNDTQFVSKAVYDAWGKNSPFRICGRVNITDTAAALPTNAGMPSSCSGGGELQQARRISFTHGGFSAVSPDSVDGPYPVSTDIDCDGRQSAFDNCPTVANWDQADGNGDGVGDACTYFYYTSEGMDVDVPLAPDVNLQFATIIQDGTTDMIITSSGPASPASYQIIPAIVPTYYYIASTAGYSGPIHVCIDYDPRDLSAGKEATLTLQHYNGSEWTDITSSLDTAFNTICGLTTSLSPFAVAYRTYICGDANGDLTANVGDAVFMINYVFKGGAAPDPIEAGDANADGQSNVGDAVYLINYVFKGGAEPLCP